MATSSSPSFVKRVRRVPDTSLDPPSTIQTEIETIQTKEVAGQSDKQHKIKLSREPMPSR
jgi:hypothetical protein